VQLTVLAVGRLRPEFRTAADDYLKRLCRYCRAAELEVREAGRAASPAEGVRIEGLRLGEKIPSGGHVVALDREGTAWSSERVAERIDRWQLAARPVSVLLGGSHGLDPALLSTAAERWSLGALTLPHELARVVVLEQLYRGFTILRGEKYHK